MCGRYRLSRRKQIIEEYFDCDPSEGDWAPRYNIAPTQPVPVIRQHPKEPVRKLTLMKWGLIPSWAKDPSIASGMINAKSETAATKPAFRDPFQFRRCLIPADGFYEWQKSGKSRQPFCFEVSKGELFAFAGLWDGWKDASGKWIKTCSILTTTPNAVTSVVHDRMPVILDPDGYDLWLDPGVQNVEAISELLKPFDPTRMRCYPVSTRINHVGNDDGGCCDPCKIPSPRIDYSFSMLPIKDRKQRESHLIATIRKNLPDFAKACADEAEVVLLHQDSFAADYQEDEYILLGMAIKYAGLRGKEVRVIGKNRSSLGESERIQ